MNRTASVTHNARLDQIGRRLAVRLDAGAADLPHDIAERLRAARMQALAQRKLAPAAVPAQAALHAGGGQAVLQGGGFPWWQRLASVLPLVALAAGLVTIHVVQNEERAREVADVDAALLTDDLPPEAYADPGFLQFLKADR